MSRLFFVFAIIFSWQPFTSSVSSFPSLFLFHLFSFLIIFLLILKSSPASFFSSFSSTWISSTILLLLYPYCSLSLTYDKVDILFSMQKRYLLHTYLAHKFLIMVILKTVSASLPSFLCDLLNAKKLFYKFIFYTNIYIISKFILK